MGRLTMTCFNHSGKKKISGKKILAKASFDFLPKSAEILSKSNEPNPQTWFTQGEKKILPLPVPPPVELKCKNPCKLSQLSVIFRNESMASSILSLPIV